MKKLFRVLVCVLPAVLYFSYYPLIHFGESDSMNFEISLPLIWLVLFDLTVMILVIHKRGFWRGILKHWVWLLLPIWLSLSVIWSQNAVRGLLTAGIMWLLFFAVYGFYYLKDLFNMDFRKKFWKVFLVSTVVVCGWCLTQCVLDLIGVGREYSLMCNGCTYTMFGFPHPNGFAIEPQFMGSLLLAPAIIIVWMLFKEHINNSLKRKSSRGDSFYNRSGRPAPKLPVSCSVCDCCKNYSGSDFLSFKLLLICFLVVISTLFLTFSRGAIYAFGVAMVFMSVFVIVREKKQMRKSITKRVGMIWGLIVLAFLFTLNLQGIMAEVSPTNDTYQSGVAKVLNHLSLGVIEIRGEKNEEDQTLEVNEADKEEAVFDGYAVESTDTRLRLTDAAIAIWRKDFATMFFGVGLGGAGQALFDNGLSQSPKEIIQNQYASLLLESGLVGASLFIMTLFLVVRAVWKRCAGSSPVMLALILAYGISLCFFAGLANALHIYILVAILGVFLLDD